MIIELILLILFNEFIDFVKLSAEVLNPVFGKSDSEPQNQTYLIQKYFQHSDI